MNASRRAFREELIADASQCHLISPEIPIEFAAFSEPLSVVLHGVKRAGNLTGKRVLITGCGPIGALCILAAQAAGAAEIFVTDVSEHVLDIARQIGVDKAINVATDPDWTAPYCVQKGSFDIMFEASGNQAALTAGQLRGGNIGIRPTLGNQAVGVLQPEQAGQVVLHRAVTADRIPPRVVETRVRRTP